MDQLDAGDYGEDEVRSLPLHVLIFTSIFFGVIDVYIFIYNKVMEKDNLGPGVGRIITVSLFGLVCFVVVLVIWPFYYANHTKYKRRWLVLTLLGALAILAYRVKAMQDNFDTTSEEMLIFQYVEGGFICLTIAVILHLGLSMLCRGKNFVSYAAKRGALLDEGLKKAAESRFSGAVNRDPHRASGGGLWQFLWPSSDVPGAHEFPITYSSKLYLATLLSFSVCLTITIVVCVKLSEVEVDLWVAPNTLAGIVSTANVASFFEAPKDAAAQACGGVLKFRDAQDALKPAELDRYCDAILAPGGVSGVAQALYTQYVVPSSTGGGGGGGGGRRLSDAPTLAPTHAPTDGLVSQTLTAGTQAYAAQQALCRGVKNFPTGEKALLACHEFQSALEDAQETGAVLSKEYLAVADDFLDAFGAYELVDTAHTFPARAVRGLEIGVVAGMAWCVYACVLAFRAWKKKMINHHFEAHAFAYAPQQAPHKFQLRFVATFVSCVLWGYIFSSITVAVASVVAPFVKLGVDASYPYILSYLAYYAILIALQNVILPVFVIDEDEMKSRKWYKFCSIALELFYFPLSLFTGLSTFVLVCVVAVLGFLRPDVCIMPAGMEMWDLGHASFVSAIRFHYRYVYHSKTDEGEWLAKNWTKKKDWVTGRWYYESDVTGRKQWNRPHWRPGKPEDEESQAKHHHKRHRRKKHGKHGKVSHHKSKRHGSKEKHDGDKGKHEHQHGTFKHLQSEARLVEGIKKAKERMAAEGGLDAVPEGEESTPKPRKSKHPHKKHGHHKHKRKSKKERRSKTTKSGTMHRPPSAQAGLRVPSTLNLDETENDTLAAASAAAAAAVRERVSNRWKKSVARANLVSKLSKHAKKMKKGGGGTRRSFSAARPKREGPLDGDFEES